MMRFWLVVIIRSILTTFMLIFVVALSHQWPSEHEGVSGVFGIVCFVTVLAWSISPLAPKEASK